MNNEKYLQDISEIKKMMNRSSRFISLSGLSGVFAGIYAIIGALIAQYILKNYKFSSVSSYETIDHPIDSDLTTLLVLVAIGVMVLAILTAVILTTRKARKNNQKIWDATSRRLLFNFFVPLAAGGFFCLVLLQQGIVGLIAPAMLIFYGISLMNASKYTFGDLQNLGLADMILGIIATQFVGYGLYFWALGFGILHIVYGIWMYRKYEAKAA
ncbi:hypothetical protein [Christiangramia flava]|uniref:Uncharacterized protein n=1 Tax=Christiangramia flava JLT2011 TaxID=1229726 RepID=A0A1L7I237_9FLAO|nr:hypothetical protein [Christiangramia flava]APU67264.1 hypothetical protein GRFL_0540 [Christiangramia flava JLT2011]OSS39850.1 hypothetical protein C723_0967 [Christiangramia flava JLT2011]